MGISVVDHNCNELIHIIIENLFLKKTNILMPINKSNMYMVASNIVQNDAEKQKASQSDALLLREYVGCAHQVQMSIDNVEVENQIDVAPFPILLSQRAPDKKKSMPFLSMEVYMVGASQQKNLTEKNLTNKIKYISSVNLYIGSVDIKIDDQTVQICMEMYKRLNLTKSQTELEEMRLGTIQKFKPVYMKLEDKETSVKGVSRVYIKMLNIEPVEINLTFRAASKLDQNTIANNFFADFGLIFASIKDASIELKGFKITHIFGTSDLLLKTVYLY